MAVAQDYMCEEFVLKRTGMTIRQHQMLTVKRYDNLLRAGPKVPILPVLQGYAPEEYASHVSQYGPRLVEGMRVGVGSVCKRNASPQSVFDVLTAIKNVRPDLRLHGFGLKITTLSRPEVVRLLYSADSMAWSFAARIEGRNQHDIHEAIAFDRKIKGLIKRAV